MHVSEAVATLQHLRVIEPYSMPYYLHCVQKPLSSHVEVYLILHLSWMKTNMCRRLQSVLALVSKCGYHLITKIVVLHMAIIRNVYDVLIHVNRIVNQLESPPNTMLLPLHIKNVAKAMAFALTLVDRQ